MGTSPLKPLLRVYGSYPNVRVINPFTPFSTGGGGFVPTDIAGCKLWLEADQLVGFSNDDPVDEWPDASGNTNDFFQVSEPVKPIYKTNIINGLPALRFTAFNNTQMVSSMVGSLPATLFAVVIPTSTPSGYRGIASVESSLLLLANLASDNKWGTYSVANAPANTQLTVNTPYALGIVSTGAFYLNGSTDGTYGGGSTNQGSKIGGDTNQTFDGDIVMVCYYDNPISSTDMSSLMTYAIDKYGI
jgi:hypothetical protein